MPSAILYKCHEIVKAKRLTMAFAESATAGRLAAEFALIPECGDILKGGVVCYDAAIKQSVLGVPKEIIDRYTPESAEVTREITERLGSIMKADIQVGITGLPMPGGSETEEKPVGTMFIHALIKGKAITAREVYQGSAEEVILQAIDRVAQLIIDEVL
jgi:nicotinamide-nucleotide amidase